MFKKASPSPRKKRGKSEPTVTEERLNCIKRQRPSIGTKVIKKEEIGTKVVKKEEIGTEVIKKEEIGAKVIKKEEIICNKKCERGSCRLTSDPTTCFAKITSKCVSFVHHTSRWYHVSCGEHFCNECFEHFYRKTKAGHEEYNKWKLEWMENSNSEASVKIYMTDQKLPYWIRCIERTCKKWRELPSNVKPTSQLISSFTCASIKHTKISCDTVEDSRVLKAYEPSWLLSFLSQPLLKDSPAADLLGAYYSDGVGLSPTCSRCVKALNIYQEKRKLATHNNTIKNERLYQVHGLSPHFEPFYQPAEQGRAFCIRPDLISVDEENEFGDITRKFPSMYLGVRNLIVTLWNTNCKAWLTTEAVESSVIVRGLIRLHYCRIAKRILKYFTEKGLINIGIVTPPPLSNNIPFQRQETVIIIGAGISGLAAAKHLGNLGFQTFVLEARNRTGGRILDDDSFNVCIGKGAQIVTGVINNPITLICEQSGLEMRFLGERCDLFANNGLAVDPIMDRDVEFHFNNTLDLVAKWRKTVDKDESLYNRIMDAHTQLLKESRLNLNVTNEQLRLFHFHLSNLEYACGSNLKNVSAKYWDQNEMFEQFSGDHTMIWKGYSAVVEKLAEDIDIRLQKIVKRVDYSKKKVKVILENNEEYIADKVLVTVPLAILQSGDIEFRPSLPEFKIEALKRLGAGSIEKIVLQFSKCFWSSKIAGADFFGYLPTNEEDRGLFPLFCDMSKPKYKEEKNFKGYVLMTYLCSDAVGLTHTKTDEEIINMCVKVLRGLFPDEDVPDPINYFVTKWNRERFSKMVYSYVKLGSSGEDYDILAQDLNKKVFFAGEATNRKFPQTVAGAYVSGIREAFKIVQSV